MANSSASTGVSALRCRAVPAGHGGRTRAGLHDPRTNVSGDDPVVTGKIALAHLNEFSDYYIRLERMEQEAKREQEG